MRERVLWIAVASGIGVLGILALTQASGFGGGEGYVPGIWNESFGEHHEKLLQSVSVIALALALLGPLFALTQVRELATFVLTLVTTILIVAAAILALVLIGRQHVSDATATDLEILTILAVTGFFLTPVIERAIETGERPPPAPAAPS